MHFSRNIASIVWFYCTLHFSQWLTEIICCLHDLALKPLMVVMMMMLMPRRLTVKLKMSMEFLRVTNNEFCKCNCIAFITFSFIGWLYTLSLVSLSHCLPFAASLSAWLSFLLLALLCEIEKCFEKANTQHTRNS